MADLQKFLKQAKYWAVTNRAIKGNKYHKQIRDITGIGPSTAWCAAFVSACSQKSGNLSVIGMNNGAGGVCNTVISKGGTWVKGPSTGNNAIPQPGDLLLKVSTKYPITYNSNGKRTSGLHGKHVAIVYKVTKTHVYTYEGNYSGGKAADVKRKLSDKTIAGYARPKWGTSSSSTSGSGSSTSSGSGTGDIGPLYKTENDRHDMTMREIGYMDDKGKLTKSTTNYRISIINYTTLLGDLFNMFVRYSYGGNVIDTSKLKGNEKIVVDYFIDQGFNAAAACGIAGNIKTDSNYNPATAVNNTYGICKWPGLKAGQMRDSVGLTSWATNLSGQLEFLMGDMEEDYAEIITTLSKVPLTNEGVKTAATTFASKYRKISSTSTRVTVAQSIFANILVTAPKQAGQSANPQTENKTCTSIDVSKKTQRVLSSCYRKFEVGMADTSMITEWNNTGKATNKGLCYLNKCYLISYNTYLGLKVGDYVELVTDYAGTIPCIVAGAFNDKNTPIQFYRDINNAIDLRAWNTAKIKQINNFGAYK